MIEKLKLNINPITRKTLEVSSALYSIVAIFLSFVSWEDIGIKNTCYRIGILVSIFLFSFLISFMYIIFIKKSRTIWKCGKGKISICYSDIIKMGFQEENEENQIIVIPVNTCFDTIVDNDVSTVDKPLVSPKSIHGQWINKMLNAGFTQEELNSKITEYLSQKNIHPVRELTREIKGRGNVLSYELGTVVALRGNDKITFFLLALSEFNESNNAHCSKDEFISCIKKLIEFYNNSGQGFEINLPLMGTNLSRVGMSHSEALHKIKAVFELYNDQIHGAVNIVIYNGDKKEVSLFD